jgi:hypothetical protein
MSSSDGFLMRDFAPGGRLDEGESPGADEEAPAPGGLPAEAGIAERELPDA